MTDFLIAFSITMLMLTLVSERMANFIKLYFQDKIIYIPWLHKINGRWVWLLKAKIKLLADKQTNKRAEKEREYRILTINIIIGIVVAVLLNLNLFEIVEATFENLESTQNNIKEFVSPIDIWTFEKIKTEWQLFVFVFLFLWLNSLTMFKHLFENESKYEPKLKTILIFWGVIFVVIPLIPIVATHILCSYSKFYWFSISDFLLKNYLTILINIIGFIGIGLFLSLGSKFWHDLLDLLFAIKNTRQHLSEPSTFTNYHSASEIANLAETSRDMAAQQLFQQYRDEIAAIDGVVSYGLNTVFDHKNGLNKRKIEVEYTSEDARKQLEDIGYQCKVDINNNPFYLKDFMVMTPTVTLEALMPDSADAVSNIILEQLKSSPKCYAYNQANTNSFGSFGVKEIEIDKKYVAISNAHVFLSNEDLKQLHNNPNYKIVDDEAKLVIGNETFDATIKRYDFYNDGTQGHDFCTCEININQEVFEAYKTVIKYDELNVSDNKLMTMFGAMSKNNVKFKYTWEDTECIVKYSGFSKKLNLHKIQAIDYGNNVQKGDSGSFINFWADHKNYTGLLVAKSDTYAYMQILK